MGGRGAFRPVPIIVSGQHNTRKCWDIKFKTMLALDPVHPAARLRSRIKRVT
jgi:hypothetical protein